MASLTPLEVRHDTIATNGASLHVAEQGFPGDARVVLLHGFPETWWSWRYQLPVLAQAGFHVIAPDQRGYGDSTRPGPYDLGTLAADVAGLIERMADGRVDLVGHDWGGMVAWHLAAVRSDLVRRLVILNAPHPMMFRRALLTNPGQMLRSLYIVAFQLPWLPELALLRGGAAPLVRALRAHAIDQTRFGDEELEPFRRAALAPGAMSAMLGWYRAALRSAFRAEHHRMVEVPTRVIWGLQDRALAFGAVVPGTRRYVRDLEVETIEGCGHFPQSERPAQVNRLLLEFLSRGSSGSRAAT